MRSGTVVAVLLGVTSLAAAEEEPFRFRLRTAYLGQPVAKAHAIAIDGEIVGNEGKATLALDPNTCTLGDFGDPGVCTLIAPVVAKVTLQQSRQRDPLELGRRRFQIDGHGTPGQWSLIVPAYPDGTYRLVHVVDDRRTVLPLERVPPAKDAKPGRKPPRGQQTCTPLPLTVDEVTATAKVAVGRRKTTLTLAGRKPHANTTIRLQPVTYVREPEYWQIEVLECSPGDIRLPAIAKYEIAEDVSGSLGTKGIVLSFADGKTIRLDVARPKR